MQSKTSTFSVDKGVSGFKPMGAKLKLSSTSQSFVPNRAQPKKKPMSSMTVIGKYPGNFGLLVHFYN
jgi:hypothetical protein